MNTKPRLTAGALVRRVTNPDRIGRLWDDELDHKGNAYVEWTNPSALQVVPFTDLEFLTGEECAAFDVEHGRGGAQ